MATGRMLIEHRGRRPVVPESAYVAPSAVLGDAVLVGPHAHVNGATIEDEVFVATGVSLFPGSVAGTGAELRINSVLHGNSRAS